MTTHHVARGGAYLALTTGLLVLILAWLAPFVPLQAEQSTKTQQVDTKLALLEAGTVQPDRDKIRMLTDYIKQEYRVSGRKAAQIVTEAVRNGAEHDLDPELILAIIAVESTFREKAVSHRGARGLMQVVPKYHPKKVKEIGGVEALFDPKMNIYTGSKILVNYLHASGGNLRNALLRYNGSLGNSRSRYAEKVLRVYNILQRLI